MIRVSNVLVATLLVALVMGCGKPKPAYQAAKVSGTVMLDGAPLEKGVINFISEGAGPGGADSAEIVAGKFEATKVPQGKVRMMIIATKETGKMVPGSSEPVPEVVSLIPDAYATGIETEIKGDEIDRKIELKSK